MTHYTGKSLFTWEKSQGQIFDLGIPEIFDLGKFDLGIPDIPHIPEIFDLGIPHIPQIPEIFGLGKFDLGIPHIPEIFDLGKFDLGIPDIPQIPEIFDLGIFAHFFLVGFSAHFVPIPPFPILLTLPTCLSPDTV